MSSLVKTRKGKAYQLRLEQQTLWVTAFGTSTLRDVEEYVREFRLLVQPLLLKPWACVLDMRQWQPSPIETFALFQDNSIWCIRHNLACAQVLLPADPLLAWQYLKSTDVGKPAGFRSERVSDEAEARKNLQALGFLT